MFSWVSLAHGKKVQVKERIACFAVVVRVLRYWCTDLGQDLDVISFSTPTPKDELGDSGLLNHMGFTGPIW